MYKLPVLAEASTLGFPDWNFIERVDGNDCKKSKYALIVPASKLSEDE